MGQTLENGVYLPSEGERNCYAGLKTNWEILDQKVADVTALQQAVAGALHREIVESLPTTDIDPNTIYMILSGTSATENVYNEYMYVNNAWELIGTSATDLTNYYTKAEVDGKLLLKASASDLTSHTGDTTIHVTASDKTKWNTVALIKQLRLVNAQVGSATTIAFANIDDTNGIKVGDKCMDLDGRMFEITAVDATNQTVTVGSALIDLALDANVVHTSGNETISGDKVFNNGARIYKSNSSENTPSFVLRTSKVSRGSTTDGGDSQSVMFNDRGDSLLASVRCTKVSNGTTQLRNIVNTTDTSDNIITCETQLNIAKNGDKSFVPSENSQVNLGSSSFGWKSVYAMNYYYGSNNVEFSTKFVTTDTTQTISGAKTFSDNLTIYNSDDTQTPKGLAIRNAQWGMGESGGTTASNISFVDKNSAIPASIIASKGISGQSFLRFSVRTKDSQNNTLGEEIYYDIDTSGNVEFRSWHDNSISLGTSLYKWKDVQTYKVNNLEPSSLSLPSDNLNDIIDISSYLSVLDGSNANTYTAPANGWISITMSSCSGIQAYITGLWGHQIVRPTAGGVRFFMPVLKNKTINILIFGGTIDNARFIPCQGNV